MKFVSIFTFLFLQCNTLYVSKSRNDFKTGYEVENFEKFDDNIVNMFLDPKKEDINKLKSEMDGFLIGLKGYVRLVRANVSEYIEKSFILKKQRSPYSIQIKVDREVFIKKMGLEAKDIKYFDEMRAETQSTWKELLSLLEQIDPKRFNQFDCFLKDNPVYDSVSESLSYHALEDD